MNLTAANGILIVAITVALGIHKDHNMLIALGFAMAGVSYIVNMADELGTSDYGLRYVPIAIGVAAYVLAAFVLTT